MDSHDSLTISTLETDLDPLQSYQLGPPNCPCSNSGRRLAVAFDGTENQFGEMSSNVVEFYARIVKDENQPSYYNSGIGTYVKPSSAKRFRTIIRKKWESLTASNFKANLLSGYRWLSENYRDKDRIFLLGFSRGAYQARVLAAMIAKVGLICPGNEEQIPFAFDIYKDATSSNLSMFSNDGTKQSLADKFKESFCRTVHVHFVGVWDTVSSVGIFRSKDFPDANSARHICFFRHALALDERRVKFIPEYVDAPTEFFSPGTYGQPRCKEVWFQGSHSDIGGGNKQNPSLDLGGVPSRWLAHEAMIMGLQLTPLGTQWDWLAIKAGPPTNSMSWFYVLLEHFPLMIRWLDFKPDPLYTRRLHKCAGRNIRPHQRIHASILISDFDVNYIPAAGLPVHTPPFEWSALVGHYTRNRLQIAHAGSFGSAVSVRPSIVAYMSFASSNYTPLARSSRIDTGNPQEISENPSYLSEVDDTAGTSSQDGRHDVVNPSSSSLTNTSFHSTRLPDSSTPPADQANGTDPQDLHHDAPSSPPSPTPQPPDPRTLPADITGADPEDLHHDVSSQYSPSASLHSVPRADSPQTRQTDHNSGGDSDPSRTAPPSPLRQPGVTLDPAQEVQRTTKERAFATAVERMSNLPGFALLELDHFDEQNIPTLVDAVVERKSNTTEFLQRLNLLAHTEPGRSKLLPARKYQALADAAFNHRALESWELGISLCWKLYSGNNREPVSRSICDQLINVIDEKSVRMRYRLRAAILVLTMASGWQGSSINITMAMKFALQKLNHEDGRHYSDELLKQVQRLFAHGNNRKGFRVQEIETDLFQASQQENVSSPARKIILHLSLLGYEVFRNL